MTRNNCSHWQWVSGDVSMCRCKWSNDRIALTFIVISNRTCLSDFGWRGGNFNLNLGDQWYFRSCRISSLSFVQTTFWLGWRGNKWPWLRMEGEKCRDWGAIAIQVSLKKPWFQDKHGGSLAPWIWLMLGLSLAQNHFISLFTPQARFQVYLGLLSTRTERV